MSCDTEPVLLGFTCTRTLGLLTWAFPCGRMGADLAEEAPPSAIVAVCEYSTDRMMLCP